MQSSIYMNSVKDEWCDCGPVCDANHRVAPVMQPNERDDRW